MDKQEVIEIVDEFLNDVGHFQGFKLWLESRGYTLEELGFQSED
jgi:hypothetical protein